MRNKGVFIIASFIASISANAAPATMGGTGELYPLCMTKGSLKSLLTAKEQGDTETVLEMVEDGECRVSDKKINVTVMSADAKKNWVEVRIKFRGEFIRGYTEMKAIQRLTTVK